MPWAAKTTLDAPPMRRPMLCKDIVLVLVICSPLREIWYFGFLEFFIFVWCGSDGGSAPALEMLPRKIVLLTVPHCEANGILIVNRVTIGFSHTIRCLSYQY